MQVLAGIPAVAKQLQEVYGTIKSDAYAPNAQVYVTGYPHIFEPTGYALTSHTFHACITLQALL